MLKSWCSEVKSLCGSWKLCEQTKNMVQILNSELDHTWFRPNSDLPDPHLTFTYPFTWLGPRPELDQNLLDRHTIRNSSCKWFSPNLNAKPLFRTRSLHTTVWQETLQVCHVTCILFQVAPDCADVESGQISRMSESSEWDEVWFISAYFNTWRSIL